MIDLKEKGIDKMNGDFKLKCPYRDAWCHKNYGTSSDVFVAISYEDSKEISEDIEEVLNKFRFNYYEALKDKTQSGMDAFCQKICGKIIESAFCIVVINRMKNYTPKPRGNPNVYFEYAIIKYLNKLCIPIARNKEDAEFDIISNELLIYHDDKEQLKQELEERIKQEIDRIKMTQGLIEKPISEKDIKIIQLLKDTITISKAPDALQQAVNMFFLAMMNSRYRRQKGVLQFIIDKIDHENEDVSIELLKTLGHVSYYSQDFENFKKIINENAMPKLFKLIDVRHNGSIRCEAFNCLLMVGDERFIPIYLKKAIHTEDNEYDVYGLQGKVQRPFIKNYIVEILTGLYKSFDDEEFGHQRATRIKELFSKLEDHLKGQ